MSSVIDAAKSRKLSVKNILISQVEPMDEGSPYHKLKQKYELNIDFMPFIKVEYLDYKEFRKQKIDFLAHTAVIFTSRRAVDHFFKLCTESKTEMPPDMKYFCVSEQTANYLQKYIVIRKRKVFVGEKRASDLFDLLNKHKNDKYLFPCSDIRSDDLPDFLEKNNFKFTEAVIYRTVSNNLENIDISKYDLLAFFSPSGVASLHSNFPEFKQEGTRIAAFGPTTAKAVRESGLILDVEAPMPNAPSMAGALELYIKECNTNL